MIENPRLQTINIRVPRRDDYENRPVLSATIHSDIKWTLVSMLKRTGMTVSEVTDEILYTGLIEMQSQMHWSRSLLVLEFDQIFVTFYAQ